MDGAPPDAPPAPPAPPVPVAGGPGGAPDPVGYEPVADTETTPDAIPVEIPPVAGTHHYLPALDGIRALAVAAVIAYHFDFHWADGGYLGVDCFFVLSGFLITSLLAGEWRAHGRIGLRGFWGRRAKRLLPAVMLLLIVLSIYLLAGGPNISAATFRPDAIATLFYYENWHLIFAHQSYFDQFLLPSPLRHTWSLSIEEQFYLLWPLLLLTVIGVAGWWSARRPGVGASRPFPRRTLIAVTVAMAVASAVDMAVLATGSADPSRAYYGTDSRAFELLIGAVLALLLVGRPAPSPRRRRLLWTVAPVAAVALGWLWVTAGDDAGNPSAWMYRGGLVLACVLTAVVIAGVAQPDAGPLGTVLSVRPLRWVGRISYGLYLWHWPVFVLMTDVTTGLLGWQLLAARLAATFAAATASFYLLERPVRRHRWRGWPFAVTGLAAVGLTVAAIAVSVPAAAALPPAHWASVRVAPPDAVPATPPPPIVLPAGRVVSPQDPLRVMLIGDSVMLFAQPGIGAALEATGDVKVVAPLGFAGWGLLNDTGWRTGLPQQIAMYKPDLIIAMWSWDNADALAHPAAYRALLTQATRVLLAPGNGVDGVAYVQFPRVGPQYEFIDPAVRAKDLAAAEAGRQAWSAIASSLPGRFPGKVTWLPVAPSLERDGQFTSWLPTTSGGWIRARTTDNTHLCPAGAAVLGAAITEELRPMFGLGPTTPGWINPSWTSNPVYDTDPPGMCPNDQPSS